MKIILILTLLNSIAIICLIVKANYNIYATFRKEECNKILVGYSLTIWKKTGYGANSIFSLDIPLKNRRKVELNEERKRLINDKTNRRYNLSAKFSWLKNWEEVRQFEKDYKIVDEDIVNELIENFVPKN